MFLVCFFVLFCLFLIIVLITAFSAFASTNKSIIVRIEAELIYKPGRTRLMFICMLRRMLLQQSSQYPSLSEVADSAGGQIMCGDKEYPFSSITNYALEYVPNSDLPLDRSTHPGRELLTSSQSDSSQDRAAHPGSDSRLHRVIHLKTEILTQTVTHVLTE